MVFKGQKYPEQAWELQKWFAGTEGERLYSSLRITIPARKSLAGVFKAKLKAANPRLTTAEVDCVVNAVPYGHAGFGYALVNWAPISDLAVTPVLDKLWLGQLTGKQAVAEMISKVKAVLKQYPAPH